MNNQDEIKFVFSGSSQFSKYVLKELEGQGLHPSLVIDDAKKELPMDELRTLKAEVFIVASFGKILPEELIYMPQHKTLNVHPSLLPQYRGPSPIQETILKGGEVGTTIMRLDEKMDHGPIIAQESLEISPWPDHYAIVEAKLGSHGGRLLGDILPKWLRGEVEEVPQDESLATYTKMIKKEDGLIDLSGNAEENYRKVLAYSTWPGAHLIFKRKDGKEIRVVVKDGELKEGLFYPTRVIPAGRREMSWEDFLRGNE